MEEIKKPKSKTKEEVIKILNDNNLEFLTEEYKTTNDICDYKCVICNHEFSTSLKFKLSQILKNPKTGCPNCYQQKLKKERKEYYTKAIEDRGFTLLEEYKGKATKILVRYNECSHEWKTKPESIVNNKIGCKICNNETKRLRLAQNTKDRAFDVQKYLNEYIPEFNKLFDNYDYSLNDLNEKIKLIDIIKVKCKIHNNIFKISVKKHLQGYSNCSECQTRGSVRGNAWLNSINENILREYKIDITNINKRGYIFVDGYCAKTNTIYEFLGDYWHGNPEFCLAEDIHPQCNKTFGIMYSETMERIEILKDLGYNVEYIWENDWVKQI